jgi:hypothetical protein
MAGDQKLWLKQHEIILSSFMSTTVYDSLDKAKDHFQKDHSQKAYKLDNLDKRGFALNHENYVLLSHDNVFSFEKKSSHLDIKKIQYDNELPKFDKGFIRPVYIPIANKLVLIYNEDFNTGSPKIHFNVFPYIVGEIVENDEDENYFFVKVFYINAYPCLQPTFTFFYKIPGLKIIEAESTNTEKHLSILLNKICSYSHPSIGDKAVFFQDERMYYKDGNTEHHIISGKRKNMGFDKSFITEELKHNLWKYSFPSHSNTLIDDNNKNIAELNKM